MAPKTVLITGASRGIGLTFVKHYVAAGWNVIAAARNVAHADNLRALAPYKIVDLDVANEESVLRAAKELEGEGIDVLINNAGVLWRETVDNTKKADLMAQFEVNAVGPFLVTRAFREHLKRAAAAHGIAKVASLSSRLASIELNDNGALYGYRASKAALNMINKSLALDLQQDKITAIVISPGFVATDMNGYTGTTSQDESVTGMMSVIDKATMAETGTFGDFTGTALPW